MNDTESDRDSTRNNRTAVSRSARQSVSQSVIQSVGRSFRQWVGQSVNQCVSRQEYKKELNPSVGPTVNERVSVAPDVPGSKTKASDIETQNTTPEQKDGRKQEAAE